MIFCGLRCRFDGVVFQLFVLVALWLMMACGVMLFVVLIVLGSCFVWF